MVIDFEKLKKWRDERRLDAMKRALTIFERKALMGMATPEDVDRVKDATRAYNVGVDFDD